MIMRDIVLRSPDKTRKVPPGFEKYYAYCSIIFQE